MRLGYRNLKPVLPDAITSELFPNPWLDQQENIFSLSYPDESIAGLVLFDVFHHLRYPGTALRELQPARKPGGRIVIVEPATGLLGRIVLGLFHNEPLALRAPITWDAPADFDPQAADYYAAQGNAWRIFGGIEPLFSTLPLRVREITYYPALPWLLTGGFRGPSLCPKFLRPVVSGLDTALSLAPRIFSSRMIILLEK